MPLQNPTSRIISRSYDGAHAEALGLQQLALPLQLGETLDRSSSSMETRARFMRSSDAT